MDTTRIEKLKEAKNKLKQDFVGISEIIDKIIDSVTPWYLTPEILERPTVVSLWGLTGTGKTSLVRKLVSYLEISDKAIFFDCGETGGETDTKLFSEKLDDLFDSSCHDLSSNLQKIGVEPEETGTISRTDPLDYTFVFDEFQYLNTKDPVTGNEENRSEGRAIWGLMDSGLIDINRYNYKVRHLIDYIEDLEFFSEEHPGLALREGRFDSSVNPLLKQQLSYYRWSEEEEGSTGYKVLLDEDSTFLIRRLNVLQKGLGFTVGEKINEVGNLSEFVKYIKGYIGLISKPKIINCSKSLVFVLGNLDEAFELTGEDLDPDIDADVYHEMTSKVNCMDIKTALRRRFRDEQVGRMGNNLIIYPSLRRCDFEEIIRREVDRITNRFFGVSGKKVVVSEKFKRLIYSEGCFPIQGVRPLYSTINTLTSPLLSMIMMSTEKEDTYILEVSGDNYNISEIVLQVLGGSGKILGEKKMHLNLGELRSPGRCKKLGLQAIHEASHAVLYHLLTGKNPSAIVASNVFGSGGYMMNAISVDSSTENIRDMRVDVIVGLAGYYGEREFFDPDMCSLGSSSDISSVWGALRSAFYNSGLKIPLRFSEPGVSTENEGLPFGFPESSDINFALKTYFDDLCRETKHLIRQEKEAIREVAKELCKSRCLGIDVFLEIIGRYLKGELQKTEENYYIDKINEKETN